MFSAFIEATSAIANKRVVITFWLTLLTVATLQIGEKTYVKYPTQQAITQTKLDNIQTTMDKMDKTLEKTADRVDALLQETLRVQAELEVARGSKRKSVGGAPDLNQRASASRD